VKLVRRFGEMWARNSENISEIPGSKDPKGGEGVYILYDGSMPVYVGKGNIHNRILRATKSETRSPFWDHFSWYVIHNPQLMHESEVLLLRMLPPYLRSLTKQSGQFLGAHQRKEERANRRADYIARKLKKGRS
jgi:hypothetical protein